MIFSSPEFLFFFLPAVVLGMLVLGRFRLYGAAIPFLLMASLVFYGWWRLDYVPVLVGTILVNHLIGQRLRRSPSAAWLAMGVAANLACLGWFKYAAFGALLVNMAAGTGLQVEQMLLPLGISFFTFQQVAYLVDVNEGAVPEDDIGRYALFVAFFPQLIAGPIIHHRILLPQFRRPDLLIPRMDGLVTGGTIFLVGLFKKVVIADNLAPHANLAFGAAADGAVLTALDAWGGALAYTLQLYFDFSGYSDMAVGLGLMFGISLPLNFRSPFKAASIIAFWDRWHITLSRFLTAYLYSPMVLRLSRWGMRRGMKLPKRGNMGWGTFGLLVAGPTLVTMGLAGLWHGAGFTFIVFGLLHGGYLVGNHAWRLARHKAGVTLGGRWWTRALGVGITFTAVVLAFVPFRAPDMAVTLDVWSAMAGANGLGQAALLGKKLLLVLAFLVAGVWLLPNTDEWMQGLIAGGAKPPARPAPAAPAPPGGPGRWSAAWLRPATVALRWQPTALHGVVMGVATFLILAQILSSSPSEFLYFNF